MKTMVVTGLSNEQDFTTGESIFVLILNREIRIPVSEEVAAQIVQEMYGETMSIDSSNSTSDNSINRSQDYEEDDGIDQI